MTRNLDLLADIHMGVIDFGEQLGARIQFLRLKICASSSLGVMDPTDVCNILVCDMFFFRVGDSKSSVVLYVGSAPRFVLV